MGKNTAESGHRWLAALSIAAFTLACAVRGPADVRQHRWWAGLGPVLPHDSFPADCGLCHLGNEWQSLHADFDYDHEAETGVTLIGAHATARCLRCHNDRGPVSVFASKGCQGCHEDVHLGQLTAECASCHDRRTWRPVGMLERHTRTRFPLVGVHAVTACHRCHAGAELGRFTPNGTECVSCHAQDLARALNPNHIALDWVRDCDRCHMPTSWTQAEFP